MNDLDRQVMSVMNCPLRKDFGLKMFELSTIILLNFTMVDAPLHESKNLQPAN
jgi:hypothetical protein